VLLRFKIELVLYALYGQAATKTAMDGLPWKQLFETFILVNHFDFIALGGLTLSSTLMHSLSEWAIRR
jgi:hypothetical protein